MLPPKSDEEPKLFDLHVVVTTLVLIDLCWIVTIGQKEYGKVLNAGVVESK
jgi:hypothetical protein